MPSHRSAASILGPEQNASTTYRPCAGPAGCLWRNTCPVHPVPNPEVDAYSTLRGKHTFLMKGFSFLLEHDSDEHPDTCMQAADKCLLIFMAAGQLFIPWNCTNSRTMDVGWVFCWRWCPVVRWLLGLHYCNRCQQEKKV